MPQKLLKSATRADGCVRTVPPAPLAFPHPERLAASTSAPPQIIKLIAKYLHLPDVKLSFSGTLFPRAESSVSPLVKLGHGVGAIFLVLGAGMRRLTPNDTLPLINEPGRPLAGD